MRIKILKLGVPFDICLVEFGSCVYLSCYIFDIPPTTVKISNVMPKRSPIIISLHIGVVMVF